MKFIHIKNQIIKFKKYYLVFAIINILVFFSYIKIFAGDIPTVLINVINSETGEGILGANLVWVNTSQKDDDGDCGKPHSRSRVTNGAGVATFEPEGCYGCAESPHSVGVTNVSEIGMLKCDGVSFSLNNIPGEVSFTIPCYPPPPPTPIPCGDPGCTEFGPFCEDNSMCTGTGVCALKECFNQNGYYDGSICYDYCYIKSTPSPSPTPLACGQSGCTEFGIPACEANNICTTTGICALDICFTNGFYDSTKCTDYCYPIIPTPTPSPSPESSYCQNIVSSNNTPQRGDSVTYTCNGFGDSASFAIFTLSKDNIAISGSGNVDLDTNKSANWTISLDDNLEDGTYTVSCEICGVYPDGEMFCK